MQSRHIVVSVCFAVLYARVEPTDSAIRCIGAEGVYRYGWRRCIWSETASAQSRRGGSGAGAGPGTASRAEVEWPDSSSRG